MKKITGWLIGLCILLLICDLVLLPLTPAAASGIIGAKLKNGALPEPVTMAATATITNITVKMAIAPASIEPTHAINVAIPPDFVKPAANTSAQMINVTVEEKSLPIPSKKLFIVAKDSLTLRRRRRSQAKLTNKAMSKAVTTSKRTPLYINGEKTNNKTTGNNGKSA